MKQSLAHTLIIISLILSLISFILSLIALYLPYWKYIQLRSISLLSTTSEDTQMDPLIRSEVEKYIEILYRPGDIHSFGLLTHCIGGGNCGRNLLPSFNETNYELCHNIKFHQQCIFSNSSLSLPKKCSCETPSYINTTHTILIIIIILEILFIIVNILRLSRRHRYCLNDIQLRLLAMVLTLFSSIFLITIIIQQNNNRLTEPLEFFSQSMHRHYFRVQIYTFSNNLELILKQIEENLDISLGASYICIIFILILTLINFLISSTVEIKNSSTFDEDEKKNLEQNHQLIHPPLPQERFIPSEQIRFIRQTKV